MDGGFKADSLGLEVQLNLMTPMRDRHSPISLSIALYIHQDFGLHAGYESCFRLSLGFCHIIQGASLLRIIGEECVLRKKYLEVIMGPISDHQLTLCPVFFIAFCDKDGPYGVLVPGFLEANKRQESDHFQGVDHDFRLPDDKVDELGSD